ncbi:MAG: acylphosphatase [Bacteroidota bacterium]|nr:acylphosphatase [Bacteroidota bacterium]
MKTVHLFISGKVQGVFFRAQAKHVAERYEIKGWIKITPDEKIEVLITGDDHHVDEFVNWCRTGPEEAKVKEVEVLDVPEVKFQRFEVIR